MVTFKSQNWRDLLKRNPKVKPFLIEVLKREHLTKIKVKLGNHSQSNANGRRISFAMNNLCPVLEGFEDRTVPLAQTFPLAVEYKGVARYLEKKGFDYQLYLEWQWTILHEVAHVKCAKIGKLDRQKKRGGGYFFSWNKKRPKRDPHGPTFRRILLNLGKKYLEIA